MNQRLIRHLLLLALVTLLSGCGQTGPLYLPDDPEPEQEAG